MKKCNFSAYLSNNNCCNNTFGEPRFFSRNRSEPARSRVRRGSISAPAPPKRGRGAQIFPRAKARNRGHSSSWEGPRAPHSLPRSVHPGTKKTTTLPGLRCISRADGARARRGCVHRTGALKANENRDTAIARPTVKAGRLIRVSFEVSRHQSCSRSTFLLFHGDIKTDFSTKN